MDGQKVRLGEHCGQRRERDAHLPGPVSRHVGVVRDEPHPERRRPLCHQGADPTEPHDSQGLAVQLDALPLGAFPPPGDQRRMGLGDVAGLGQQQGHGVLGGGKHVGLGSVDDHHAPAGGGRHVDVVEPDAGPPDDDEIMPGVNDLGGDLGGRTDDQGGRARHLLEQFGRAEPGGEVNVVAGSPQQVQTGIGDGLGHQDSGHGL